MYPRKDLLPVGLGPMGIPYDQSGGQTMAEGMSVPSPQGPMKSMKFDFHDPAQQAAMQAAQQAGIPPAGMQPPAQPDQQQAPPQADMGAMLGQPDQVAGGMPQGGESSMLSDDQLAGMLQDEPMDPVQLQADQMEQGLMGGDPELQMQMMQAARRMGGF